MVDEEDGEGDSLAIWRLTSSEPTRRVRPTLDEEGPIDDSRRLRLSRADVARRGDDVAGATRRRRQSAVRWPEPDPADEAASGHAAPPDRHQRNFGPERD